MKNDQEAKRSLYETQGKLQKEIGRLREELQSWKKQNEDL